MEPLSLISLGLQGVTSLGNWIFGNKSQRENREYNEQQARLDRNFQLAMWNQNNLYNTPSAQMQRFKDAGLNPNLIYGKGTPGLSTTLPRYSAIRDERSYIPLQLPNVLGMFQDFEIKNAQIDNLKAIGENLAQDKITKTLNNSMLGLREQSEASRLGLSLEGMKQKNRLLANQVIGALKSNSKAALELDWLQKKSEAMNRLGINIDRDDIRTRVIGNILIDLQKRFLNKNKGGLSPYFNY